MYSLGYNVIKAFHNLDLIHVRQINEGMFIELILIYLLFNTPWFYLKSRAFKSLINIGYLYIFVPISGVNSRYSSV